MGPAAVLFVPAFAVRVATGTDGMNNMEVAPSAYRHFEVTKVGASAEIHFHNGKNNFITSAVLSELDYVLDAVLLLENIHCVVIASSTAGVFSCGLDVGALRALNDTQRGAFFREAERILTRLASVEIPLCCAIDGDCFGAGLEIALRCDFRIASDAAKFASPEVIFGLAPTEEFVRRLLSLTGHGLTSRLLMTGMTLDAREASRIGLLEELVPAGELQSRCRAVAARLGRIDLSAIKAVKSKIMQVAKPSGATGVEANHAGLTPIRQKARYV